jgi:uncharacterized protein (DUF2236 family)
MVEDDIGLFGPDSVTWRVHAEPILWLAGLRAVLLQILHPRALAGVMQNSTFRSDPWGRLERTARFYGYVIFGTTACAENATARVRAIHARLRATDPATGERFRIDEPELLRWVHVTATESFVGTACRAGLSLSTAEVDRYHAEQLTVATRLGLNADTVPASAEAVEAYYAAMRPQLSAAGEARATAAFLAVPPLPWGLGFTPARAAWIAVAAHAFALLPAWARRCYGLPGLISTDVTATVAARALRLAGQALPARALEGPIYRAAMQRAARWRAAVDR